MSFQLALQGRASKRWPCSRKGQRVARGPPGTCNWQPNARRFWRRAKRASVIAGGEQAPQEASEEVKLHGGLGLGACCVCCRTCRALPLLRVVLCCWNRRAAVSCRRQRDLALVNAWRNAPKTKRLCQTPAAAQRNLALLALASSYAWRRSKERPPCE